MPRRRPLTIILVNISTRCELSSDAKSKLYGRTPAGQSASEIEAKENVPKLTINHLLQRIEQCNTMANLPRNGRPRVHNDGDKQQVIRQVRLSPKITYEDLQRSTGLEFSNKLLRGILKDHGILN